MGKDLQTARVSACVVAVVVDYEASGWSGRRDDPRTELVLFKPAVLERSCPTRVAARATAVSEATERYTQERSKVLTVSLLDPPLVSVQTTWDGLQG